MCTESWFSKRSNLNFIRFYQMTSLLLTINSNICLLKSGILECVWVMREPVNWNKYLFQSLKPLARCGYKMEKNPIIVINNSIYRNFPNEMKTKVVLLLLILMTFIASEFAIKFPRGSGLGSGYCQQNFCKCFPQHPRCRKIGLYAWAIPLTVRLLFEYALS